MRSLENVLGDEELSTKLRQSLDQLPDFLNETRQTMTVARTTFGEFQRVSKKAEANLDNLEEFTRPLAQRGAELIENVDESTRNLNELLVQLVAFSEALNSGQGTLGKLVYDDEVYGKINRLVGNAEDLSRRLRPIVEDVRIFTDKIARDPRQLGLSGALSPRPTGLKTSLRW
jgi:phospholipid/cholesterol/gamma-HCH transport system substrate-binding protein